MTKTVTRTKSVNNNMITVNTVIHETEQTDKRKAINEAIIEEIVPAREYNIFIRKLKETSSKLKKNLEESEKKLTELTLTDDQVRQIDDAIFKHKLRLMEQKKTYDQVKAQTEAIKEQISQMESDLNQLGPEEYPETENAN